MSATRTRNVLFAAADSTGEGFGQIFNVNVTNGIKNPDGSFYRAGQPLANISSQNQVVSTGAFPLTGQWIDPRLQQPYTQAGRRSAGRTSSARRRRSAPT